MDTETRRIATGTDIQGRLEDALQDCLAVLETGRATVEECLAHCSDLAADLESLVRMGQRLQIVLRVEPSPRHPTGHHLTVSTHRE